MTERTDVIYLATAESERAWAAGLFEGEGSFHWQTTDGRKYPRATLGTTDPDVLRRFVAIVGVGEIYADANRPEHWKPIEKWAACGIENVRRVAEVVGPYLGERRSAKMAEMLTWQPAERPPRRNHCADPVTGSAAGYNAHRAHGEPVCERCRASRKLYSKQRRDSRVH